MGHRVGLAQRRLAGLGVRGLEPIERGGQLSLRIAAGFEVLEIGENHREVAVLHGFGLTVNEKDWEGLAPISLPREQPVSELVVDLAGAVPVLLEPIDHARFRRLDIEPVQELAVDCGAVAQVSLAVELRWRLYRADDRK